MTAKYVESRGFRAKIYFRSAINFVCSTFIQVVRWSCGCLKPKDRRYPVHLGIFLQPHSSVYTYPERVGTPTTVFLPTSDKGKALAEGKWGALDASLSFIGQRVYIKGTSNSFLLCSFELKPIEHYCVCNPVTREWKILPKPNKVYDYVALAFFCEEESETSLDRLHFTIVQAGVEDTMRKTTTLVMETYSSETGEWRESTLTCASPFNLVVANRQALVTNNVIYWIDVSSNVVAYDQTNQCLEVIEVPAEFCGTRSYVWAISEGKIHYARNNLTHFELWRLERNRTTEWTCIARVSIAKMFENIFSWTPEGGKYNSVRVSIAKMFENIFSWTPEGGKYNSVGVQGIHPHNSKQIFFTLTYTPLWYNLDSGEADLIADTSNICGSIPWNNFMYDWPSVS